MVASPQRQFRILALLGLGRVVSYVIAVCKPPFSALPVLMYVKYTPLRFSKTAVFAAR